MSPPDGPPPPLPDFEDLALRITRTRNDFGRVYDEVRATVPGSRPFIAVSSGATSDALAFANALRRAHEEGWFTALGERLVHDRFFPGQSAAVTDLQAVISVARGFPDATVVTAGGLRATARLCRVEVASDNDPQHVTGTGFLVGPSTVLTSFHVVAGLVDDQSRSPRPGSDRALRVRFDHATGRREGVLYRVPQSWLVAWRPPDPAELESVESGAAGDLVGRLDYAVIGVAGSPGSERGFFDLERAVEPVLGSTVHLFQHPMGVEQRVSDGVFSGFREQTDDQRINHTANALRGSSGGLLVDGNYDLVGLHQGAIPLQPGSLQSLNTGISALAIRDDVRDQGANLLDASYAQRFRVVDDSRPILGRTRCQELLLRSSKPLVRIKPFAGTKGVSFSIEVMRACLPESEHLIKSVLVLELHSDARETAALLLDRLDLDQAGLPEEASVDTSRGAWISQLTAMVVDRVEKGHPNRTVWLVIDDLEKPHPVPDGSVRDFLSELYRQVPNCKNLKIVLLGMAVLPSGFPTGFVEEEDISVPQAADIAAYVRLRLTAGGVDHSAGEVERLAELIGVTSGFDIQSLSDYVAEKVDRVLNKAIEAST